MTLISRILEAVEARLDHSLGRHLSIALPEQRVSVSPLAVLNQHSSVERIGAYPCCSCCLAYTPQPCPVIHRSPCDKSECCQDWAGDSA